MIAEVTLKTDEGEIILTMVQPRVEISGYMRWFAGPTGVIRDHGALVHGFELKMFTDTALSTPHPMSEPR